MSYDLWFRSERQIPVEELRAYFADQPHFAVSEDRAHYENDTTGVYFGFDFGERDDAEDDAGRGLLPVAFNINFYRPHVFGLEAEPVLTRFVEAFALGVDDPHGGMDEGHYSPEGFLRGWNYGNEAGYGILTRDPSWPAPLTLPSARIRSHWQWSFAREQNAEAMYDLIGEVPACFLPTLYLFEMPGHEVKSAIVWDTEIPIAIPEVDVVMTRADDGLVAVPVSAVLDIVPIHTTWNADHELARGLPVGSTVRLIDEPSADVRARLRTAMRPFSPVHRLRTDQVLDAELVAEARAT